MAFGNGSFSPVPEKTDEEVLECGITTTMIMAMAPIAIVITAAGIDQSG